MRVAYRIAKESLPAYSHENSPKKYTQHQLFACLVLKSMLDLKYRTIAALLEDCSDLRAVIELKEAPHFSTLQKAASRLLREPHLRRLHDATIRGAEEARILKATTDLVAVDASGFEARHISRYFVRRRRRGQKRLKNPLYETTTYRRFPKASIAADRATHLVLAVAATRGPASDLKPFVSVMRDACRRRRIRMAALDAGYDAEWVHEYLRLDLGVRSIIPPKIGRPSARPPNGRYRGLMHRRFPKQQYGQRWQAETVFSMIKRRQGDAVHAISHHAQRRALMLKVLTHNIMILWRRPVGFLQSRPNPIPTARSDRALSCSSVSSMMPGRTPLKRAKKAGVTGTFPMGTAIRGPFGRTRWWMDT